jgi:hypothetical protein|tara:strand:- start:52 stop:219 length:168 start_codon:yes stop_codon:yes gene_type:complete
MQIKKPTADEVMDKLDDTLKSMVGESWEMMNIDIEDGGVTMTLSFWDIDTEYEDS